MQGRLPRARTHTTRRDAVLRGVVMTVVACVSMACDRRPEVVIRPAGGTPVHIRVELALTLAEQERGLMYRQSLDKDAGMLFVFPESEIRTFWMKNTPLPLDMIFIGDDNDIVGILERAVPFTTTPRMVGKPARYVLEVNGGFAADHKIKPGDHIDMPPIAAGR